MTPTPPKSLLEQWLAAADAGDHDACDEYPAPPEIVRARVTEGGER